MQRKKRTPSRSAGRIHGGGIRDDRYLLDEFTTQDLRRWKHNSNLLNEYRVRQFYELESQFGPVLGQAWVDWQDGAKKAAIVADLQDRFSEADIPAEGPRATWLPEGF